MPRRKGGKKRRSRSRTGISNTLSPNYKLVHSDRAGFPSALRCRLRYSDQISLDPLAGLKAEYVFRANSIYDPDYTSTGHQPLGTDQLLGVAYNHYHVVSATMTIQPVNTGSGTTGAICMSLSDVNTMAALNLNDIVEDGNTAVKLINGDNTVNPIVMKGHFNSAKYFRRGVEKELSGTVAANPAEQAYFILTYFAAPQSADAPECSVRVVIDYEVLFSEPKHLAGS